MHGSEQEIVESANQIDILHPEGIGGERGDTFASSKQWVSYRFCFDIDSTPFRMSSSKQIWTMVVTNFWTEQSQYKLSLTVQVT